MNEDVYIPVRNPEGYLDLTAHAALSNVARERQTELDDADLRCNRMIKSIKALIDLSGFDVITRIEVRDRKTGRIYR